MKRLHAFLDKHEKIRFICKVLKWRFNNKFVKHVNSFSLPVPPVSLRYIKNDVSYDISIHSEKKGIPRMRNIQMWDLGEKNKGKVVFLMNNRAGHGGFCGLWIYYLNRLAFSDKMGFYHVMNCVQSDFYQEDHPIHGTRNVFEYYFQQPCGISLKSALQSKNVVFDWNNDDYGFNDSFHVGGPVDYTFKNSDIKQFAELQKKYIKFQPSIEKKLLKQTQRLLGNRKVVAVHARGTDYKVPYKGHPIAISPEDYLETAKILADKIGATHIFLATDDITILNLFKNDLGDKLIYFNDVIRSEGTVWNCYVKSDVKNPHFRLGYEIIRDVFAMASCDGFVCGLSYVSFMVQVLKKSWDKDFLVFQRLSHGLRKEGLDLTSDKARAAVRVQWAKELEIEQKRMEARGRGLDPDKIAPLMEFTV